MLDFENQIQRLAFYIKEAQKITVLTGAGISTESGIPDFRSSDGFWKQKGFGHIKREDVMSLRYLQRQPEHFWDAYKDTFKIKLMNDFQPNFGHLFLAELEKMGKEVTIITQNVDGLHKKAGSTNVYEAHGSIDHAICPKCDTKYDLDYINNNEFPECNHIINKKNTCNNYIVVSQFNKNYGFVTCDKCSTKHVIDPGTETVRCKGKKKSSIDCNSYLKPGVVLFGDAIKYYNEGVEATINSDLFLVLGSSLQVGPINELPAFAQHKNKDRIKIIINRDPTDLDDYFDEVVHAQIGETFKQVSEILALNKA